MKAISVLLALVFMGPCCAAVAQADEPSEIRLRIYLQYLNEIKASDRFVYFIKETDAFVAALKTEAKLSFIENREVYYYDEFRDETVHKETGQAGIRMSITKLSIHGDTATATFEYDATSICAGGYSARLTKKEGAWSVVEWSQTWIS